MSRIEGVLAALEAQGRQALLEIGRGQHLAVDGHRRKNLHRAGLAVGGDRPVNRAAPPAADQVLQFMSGNFGQTHACFGCL
mgnify:CR=1 FL=1